MYGLWHSHVHAQRVFEATFLNRPAIIKERFSKKYRHPTLDTKISTKRTNMVSVSRFFWYAMHQEVRIIAKCHKAGLSAPLVYFVNRKEGMIYMQKVEGKTVKQLLWDNDVDRDTLAHHIGAYLAKMHDNDIIHGDLTTSNMIYHNEILVWHWR